MSVEREPVEIQSVGENIFRPIDGEIPKQTLDQWWKESKKNKEVPEQENTIFFQENMNNDAPTQPLQENIG